MNVRCGVQGLSLSTFSRVLVAVNDPSRTHEKVVAAAVVAVVLLRGNGTAENSMAFMFVHMINYLVSQLFIT